MRVSRVLFAALVALGAAIGFGGGAQAAPAPDGSYKRTCNAISALGDVLSARCLKGRTLRVKAALVHYADCYGDIANVDGRLVCIGEPGARGDIVLFEHPNFRGRSVGLASDVTKLPKRLNDIATSVRVRRGIWKICANTFYLGHCEFVRGDVADLKEIGLNDAISSVRRMPDPPLPGGAWRQSCRNGALIAMDLTADCQDRQGRWRTSTLDLRTCNGLPPSNENGRLVCDDGEIDLPYGRYQESCRTLTFDGRWLSGDCRAKNGAWAPTRLDTRSCDRDEEIANDDGELVCAPRGPTPPPGTYRQSCRSFDFDGRFLGAECRDRSGAWLDTRLDTRKCERGVDIGNADGALFCGDYTTRPLPAGSYQQTCRQPRLDGNILRADCQDRSNNWRATGLDVEACRGSPDIYNDNGILKCAIPIVPPGPAPLPPPTNPGPLPPAPPPPTNPGPFPPPAPQALPDGSYQRSCRSIAVVRDVLRAECRDASGGWLTSSVDLNECPGAPDIYNNNGTLKCAIPIVPTPPAEVAPPAPALEISKPPADANMPPLYENGGDGAGDRSPRPLPSGSYQASCRSMSVVRGTLSGECKDATDAWVAVTLDLRTCNGTGDIANDRGVLKCLP